MNKFLIFLGLRKKHESNFSKFFMEFGNERMNAGEKKKIILKAIRAANQDQKLLVDKVERMYTN